MIARPVVRAEYPADFPQEKQVKPPGCIKIDSVTHIIGVSYEKSNYRLVTWSGGGNRFTELPIQCMIIFTRAAVAPMVVCPYSMTRPAHHIQRNFDTFVME